MTVSYTSPFSDRYASQEMKKIFSAQCRHTLWRQVWCSLAESQKELGLAITDEQLDELRAHTETIDFTKVSEFEKVRKHDVMAHLDAYGMDCPRAKAILHLGATSCNITDNADVIQQRMALDLINQKLRILMQELSTQATKHKEMPCLAYTHFQSAQPTTVGKRFALWLQGFWDAAVKTQKVTKSLRLLGMKGATGTQNSFLELFENDHAKVKKVEKLVVKKLGFTKIWPLSGQTYPREQDVEVMESLAKIARNAKKMATDLRLLAHEKEVEEPFEKEQVGSSAMPYKRNPITFEKVCSLARVVMQAPDISGQVAAEQWLERTLDDSASRRIVIAEAFLATDAILDSLIQCTKNMVIYPKMIKKNLKQEVPFMATENILMELCKKGCDRQKMHERLRIHSQACADRMKLKGRSNDLLKRIVKDPKIPISKKELGALIDARRFVGRAPEQVDEFVNRKITPFLEKV